MIVCVVVYHLLHGPDCQRKYFDLKDKFIRNKAYVDDRRRFRCLGYGGELEVVCSSEEC